MRVTKIRKNLLLLALTALISVSASAATDTQRLSAELREEMAYTLGVQAYIYAYPLVHTNLFRWMWHDEKSPRYVGPANKLNHFRELMNAESTVAATPNNDTLYTLAFLDLNESPVVIEVPEMGDRYYTVQLADMYASNFGVLGTRATQAKAGRYLVVPPNWSGTVPKGIEAVHKSPTPWVMALLRILVDGKEDLPDVNALQDKFKLLNLAGEPLPAYSKPMPDIAMADKPLDVWRVINRGLTANPPVAHHANIVRQFRPIGVGVGLSQDLSTLDDATKRGLARAADTAHNIVKTLAADISTKNVNNWGYPDSAIGRYGDDFAYRAAVTLMGLMANDPEEAVYMSSYTDANGVVLDGKQHYTLHFDADNLPPAGAFWSNTMYDSKTYGFSNNILNRFSIGDRTERLKYNDDGSLDIFIGPKALNESEISNWLPTPDGEFYMFLRLYLPNSKVLDQTWAPPKVMPR